MTSKLVRESDGFKFYSIAHESKEHAERATNSTSNKVPMYDSITKAWYNTSTLGGISYQEDFRVDPKQ